MSMCQIEEVDGHHFMVWWHHERDGGVMSTVGGYIQCRECQARLGERSSVKLCWDAMELHADRRGRFGSCRKYRSEEKVS